MSDKEQAPLKLDHVLRSPENKICDPQDHVWGGKTSLLLSEVLLGKKNLTFLVTDAEGGWWFS